MSSSTTDRNPANVLVVDDDPRNRRLLEGYLSSEGYQVRSACDGPEALAIAHQEVPDIVLLDVMMPGMTGHEVCRDLKNRPDTRLTQVVLVTALEGTPHRVEGLDCGADDFVSKPVRREEFMAKIRSLLRARHLLLELEEARSRLAERNAKLEELEALKETLVQTLVHDLKNPLAVLVGNLDLLVREGDERVAHRVQRCKAGASRMHRMILDLLDVAGLEEGRVALKPEALETVALVQTAMAEAEVSASHRGVNFRFEAPNGKCPVTADVSVLRRVLDNLLANAVEHSPSGGTVTASVSRREEGIEISVADEGTGIPEEHRERIFEKYARLELQKAGVSANRGLGLTFCRLAVEAHGGTIWAEDAPGGGALFRVLLPATEAPALTA